MKPVCHARDHWAAGADPAAGRWVVVGDGGDPVAPDYESLWDGDVRFRYDGNGDTELDGEATGGDYGDPIFYLPAAYWPPATKYRVGALSDFSFVVVEISHVDGAVTIYAAS